MSRKNFDYVRSGDSYGAVELDEDGEWKTENGRYVGGFIGCIHADRMEAIEMDFNNKPRRTKLGYWAHWEQYEGQIESFKVVKIRDLPRAIKEDIDVVFDVEIDQEMSV